MEAGALQSRSRSVTNPLEIREKSRKWANWPLRGIFPHLSLCIDKKVHFLNGWLGNPGRMFQSYK